MAGHTLKNCDLLLCIKSCHPETRINDSKYMEYSKLCLQKLCIERGIDFSEDSLDYTSKRFCGYVRYLYNKPKNGRHFDRLQKCTYFGQDIVLRSCEKKPDPVPPIPPPPPMPAKSPPKTRKAYDQKGKRQQNRERAAIRAKHEPNAILDASIQTFRDELQSVDAAFVVKCLKSEPKYLGKDLRQFITQRPDYRTQIPKHRALAYIMDRHLTRIDYEELCALVNTPEFYLLPCWTVLSQTKKKDRPEGKSLTT